jgi:phage-related protein
VEAFLIRRGRILDVYALGKTEENVLFLEEHLNHLDEGRRRKVRARINYFSDTGPPVRNMDVSRKLTEHIFELKARETRILYFYDVGDRIIITHAFSKAGRKTPLREIRRAEQLRYHFLSI